MCRVGSISMSRLMAHLLLAGSMVGVGIIFMSMLHAVLLVQCVARLQMVFSLDMVRWWVWAVISLVIFLWLELMVQVICRLT